MATATIQLKRDSSANWASSNPVLHDGEPGIEETVAGFRLMKIGDGATAWNSLPYEGPAIVAQGNGSGTLASTMVVDITSQAGLYFLYLRATGSNIDHQIGALLSNGGGNDEMSYVTLINGAYNNTPVWSWGFPGMTASTPNGSPSNVGFSAGNVGQLTLSTSGGSAWSWVLMKVLKAPGV